MMHVILGLFFVALGIWGIFDEWYYVLDYVKAASSLFLLVGGLVALLAGVTGRRPVESSEEPGEGDDDLPTPGQAPFSRSEHEGSERNQVH